MTESPAIQITGTWERPAVPNDAATTTLLLTVEVAATAAQAERLPIDLALVLDRSGSMAGDKLELAKRAALEAVGHLGPSDRLGVVLFDDEIEVLLPLSAVSPSTREQLATLLRAVDAGRTTFLSGGWLAGCELLAESGTGPDRLRRAVLLTDGQANEGITGAAELARHAGALRRRGIATSTMGVGQDFDETVLGAMAEAGGGSFRYLSRATELSTQFRDEVAGMLDVVAPRPKLHVTLPPGVHATLVNPFPVSPVGATLRIDLADLRAGDRIPLVFDVALGAGEALVTPIVALVTAGTADAGVVGTMEPLARVPAAEVERHPARDDVRIEAARIRADRDHREAMRLDREGRVEEARAVFASAHRVLRSAPDSAEIRMELEEAQILFDNVGHHDEHTRKDRVHRAMQRSRGRRDPS